MMDDNDGTNFQKQNFSYVLISGCFMWTAPDLWDFCFRHLQFYSTNIWKNKVYFKFKVYNYALESLNMTAFSYFHNIFTTDIRLCVWQLYVMLLFLFMD